MNCNSSRLCNQLTLEQSSGNTLKSAEGSYPSQQPSQKHRLLSESEHVIWFHSWAHSPPKAYEVQWQCWASFWRELCTRSLSSWATTALLPLHSTDTAVSCDRVTGELDGACLAIFREEEMGRSEEGHRKFVHKMQASQIQYIYVHRVCSMRWHSI